MGPVVNGDQIDQYIIKKQIGEGGMGVVYTAEQPSMRRDVAIKFLADMSDEDSKKRFEREAQMLAHLEHPHVLPVFAFGEFKTLPYIVMRFIGNGTLSDRMKRGQLTIAQIQKTLRQIAGALDYAHDRGVVHRDLKPGNIFFDELENAYLGDFGLAKPVSGSHDLTKTDEGITGTPDYMSPEQIRGMPLSAQTDIYSLGVIAYQCLTGTPPFTGKNAMEIVLQHLSQKVPSVTERAPLLPPQIDLVFQKVLAKEANDRYNKAIDFVDALQSALTEGLATSYPPAAGNGDVTHNPITLIRTTVPKTPDEMQTIPSNMANSDTLYTEGQSAMATIPSVTKDPKSESIGVPSIHMTPEEAAAQSDRSGENRRLLFIGLGVFGVIVLIGYLFTAFALDPIRFMQVTPTYVATGSGPRSLVPDNQQRLWVINTEESTFGVYSSDCGPGSDVCGNLNFEQSFLADNRGLQRPVAVTSDGENVYIGFQLGKSLVKIGPEIGIDVNFAAEFAASTFDLVWAGDRLWVASGSSVFGFDAAGNLLGTIEVGGLPSSIAASPDGERLWVVSEQSQEMRVIDISGSAISQDQIIDVIDLEGNLGDEVRLRYSGDALWVIKPDVPQILKYDPETLTVLANYAVGDQPFDVLVVEDQIWVADFGSSGKQIHVLSAENGDALGAFDVDGRPSAMVLMSCSADSTDLCVWFTLEQTNQLGMIPVAEVPGGS